MVRILNFSWMEKPVDSKLDMKDVGNLQIKNS